MAEGSGSLLLGEDPKNAARQAAVLFMISGVLAMLAGLTGPDLAQGLLWVGLGDLLVGCVTWVLPWQRWRRNTPLILAVPALGLLAYATFKFSGFGAGTGPFFVLTLAWVGLHYSMRTLLYLLPPIALAYALPLAVSEPPAVVGRPTWVTFISGMVLVGTGMAVAFIISGQVARQRRTLRRVREMEQWRAALMAALAHDVRAPITSVLFSLEMLDEDEAELTPEQRAELVATALRQTGRIERLADGLLDLERINEEGRLRLDLQDVALRALVQTAVSFTAAPDTVVDVDPALAVRADAERLEQILINLLGNAVRHGLPPVVVTARPVGDTVRLKVRDHGTGVPDELKDRLFDRFSSSFEHAGSVGLGLWITRQLVEAHGGRVFYEPADPGACFVLELPRAAGAGDVNGRDDTRSGLSREHGTSGVRGTSGEQGASGGRGTPPGVQGQRTVP